MFWRDGFDDELDDYPPNYKVYLIKNMTLTDAYEPSEPQFEFVNFRNIPLLLDNKIIGEIPTKEVVFDETKRKFVNSKIFTQLLKNN